MFTQLSNFATFENSFALHNTWCRSTACTHMYVHMCTYLHDSDKRQEGAEGRELLICTVEPPPGFVISLHCLHRALAVRVGKTNMQFTSLCFPSLGLSKPAGIPGDDMNKRQDVAKGGNRHRGTQKAVSGKHNSTPQMILHPSRSWLDGIYPSPKAALHLHFFWTR